MTIGNRPPTVRADGRGPRPAAGHVHARRPEVGRGLVPDPGRRHGGPVRGHDRGPGPAAPPRQGHGLGHRRVLDAAAGHRRADRARVGQGPDRRPDPRDPAPDRALAARRGGPGAARRAHDHRRLRRAPGRRRHAHRLDHRRLRRPGRRAHHLRHGAPPGRQGRGGLGRHRRRPALPRPRLLGGLARRRRLQRRRHRRRRLRRAPGHGRGQAVRPGGRRRGCSTWPTGGLARLFEAQAAVLATVRR